MSDETGTRICDFNRETWQEFRAADYLRTGLGRSGVITGIKAFSQPPDFMSPYFPRLGAASNTPGPKPLALAPAIACRSTYVDVGRKAGCRGEWHRENIMEHIIRIGRCDLIAFSPSADSGAICDNDGRSETP
jgi:hypothetical protein